jgi:hypothetical protein
MSLILLRVPTLLGTLAIGMLLSQLGGLNAAKTFKPQDASLFTFTASLNEVALSSRHGTEDPSGPLFVPPIWRSDRVPIAS